MSSGRPSACWQKVTLLLQLCLMFFGMQGISGCMPILQNHNHLGVIRRTVNHNMILVGVQGPDTVNSYGKKLGDILMDISCEPPAMRKATASDEKTATYNYDLTMAVQDYVVLVNERNPLIVSLFTTTEGCNYDCPLVDLILDRIVLQGTQQSWDEITPFWFFVTNDSAYFITLQNTTGSMNVLNVQLAKPHAIIAFKGSYGSMLQESDPDIRNISMPVQLYQQQLISISANIDCEGTSFFHFGINSLIQTSKGGVFDIRNNDVYQITSSTNLQIKSYQTGVSKTIHVPSKIMNLFQHQLDKGLIIGVSLAVVVVAIGVGAGIGYYLLRLRSNPSYSHFSHL